MEYLDFHTLTRQAWKVYQICQIGWNIGTVIDTKQVRLYILFFLMLWHSEYLPKYFEFSIIGFIYGVPPEFDYVYVLDVVSTNRWVGSPKIVEPVSPNMRSNFSSIFYFFHIGIHLKQVYCNYILMSPCPKSMII